MTKKYLGDPQSVYFIKYENFVKEFSKVIIIKTFPESNWFQYSTKSAWIAGYLGGIPQNLESFYPENQRLKRKTT